MKLISLISQRPLRCVLVVAGVCLLQPRTTTVAADSATHAAPYLATVRQFADQSLAQGRDVYGKPTPLWLLWLLLPVAASVAPSFQHVILDPRYIYGNLARRGAAPATPKPGSPSPPPANGPRMVFPERDWAEATPESQGVDGTKLKEAVAWLDTKSQSDGAKALVIVWNGRLIWKGPEADAYRQVFSCTKVFTSTVLGLLVDDGKRPNGTWSSRVWLGRPTNPKRRIRCGTRFSASSARPWRPSPERSDTM